MEQGLLETQYKEDPIRTNCLDLHSIRHSNGLESTLIIELSPTVLPI